MDALCMLTSPQHLVGVCDAATVGQLLSVISRLCRLFDLLRPGGRLLVTDYCTGEALPSPGFQAYITQRGYKLVTLAAYSDYIRDAGFDNVVAEDRTAQVQHAQLQLCSTTTHLSCSSSLSERNADAR